MSKNISDITRYKNYYEVSYESFPIGNYYLDKHHIFPSIYNFADLKFTDEVLGYLLREENFNLITQKTSEKNIFYEVVMERGDLVAYLTFNHTTNNLADYKLKMYYPIGQEPKELFGRIESAGFIKKKNGNISLVRSTNYGLDAVDFDVKSEIDDIAMSYGDDFIPIHEKIVEKLSSKDSKGIVLFHGDPGTGKSFYLKHLSTLLQKKVLWLPQTAADILCNPEFITFLMDNTNSILILEDAERVIKSRMQSDAAGNAVANLLNMTDGILSDCLHVQIIATFNTSKELIDKALRRKGRLIAEHEFKKLPVEQSNKLMKHLNIDHTTTTEMTLADIYNFHDTIGFSDINERKRISLKHD